MSIAETGRAFREHTESRIERDILGERVIPGNALYGIHTIRALDNFTIAGQPVHPELVKAYGAVKLACARVNASLGTWTDPAKAEVIQTASRELAEGAFTESLMVDSLQGGAGTSTNMNVNEVIANRALQLLDMTPGQYDCVSPLDDINLHQSTNDTFPTALRIAALRILGRLEKNLLSLQEAFQQKEREFADIVKVGRTELQDAVLVTLGREMGAYAESINRDRWRIGKCEERLRVVNLGGTAIGTGIGAPRQFIFSVVDTLREITGLSLARSENLIDATQNADCFVEVSGILKACAVNLIKISNDLRLLSSGPSAGFGEITLPARQAGSSIMPGKVNPVIPEAVAQAGLLVIGLDSALTSAAALGNLELNQFMPLIAHCLLNSLDYLERASGLLRSGCIEGMRANRERCSRLVENTTATLTALVETIGYEKTAFLAEQMCTSGKSVRDSAVGAGLLSESEYEQLVSPEAVMRLGSPNAGAGGIA